MTTAELRKQARQRLNRLSPEHVAAAAAYLAELEERESREATAELLAIPGFIEELEEAELEVARGDVVDWDDVALR
ncbi:MAG: hypothetical protein ACKVVT_03985 [Dehalococcoidia bacterium]